MDPAGTGALIGISVMVCAGLIIVCNDKGTQLMEKCKKRYQTFKQQQQPLLPVVKENPVLVRSTSKQFQMKDIIPK